MYFSHNKQGLLPYTAVIESISQTETESISARYVIDQVNVIKELSSSGVWRLVLGKMDTNVSVESLLPAFR